jgi:large subunit ribosomal protein L31
MKPKIHPKYEECKVTCGCGETFATRSTASEIRVDICSACHPFYTGRQKFVDTAGRIEKFNRKFSGFDATAGKGDAAADAPAEAAAEATAEA